MSHHNQLSIKNNNGLAIKILENGQISEICAQTVRINLKPTHCLSTPINNIYLRSRGEKLEFHPLLGAKSKSQCSLNNNQLFVSGQWNGFKYQCVLSLSSESHCWHWSINVTNTNKNSAELDLIYVQDIGLTSAYESLCNEYYTSQYIERRVFNHPIHGSVVCCRQNIKGSTGNPWIMVAANSASSASVDGIQFYGSSYRKTGIPEGLLSDSLSGEYSGELSIVAIQQTPFTLTENQHHESIFSASYLPNHPNPTSEQDLDRVVPLFSQLPPQREINDNQACNSASSLFQTARLLQADDLSNDEITQLFGEERRHIETNAGKLLSFFSKTGSHIVLQSKELLVERPHGHIMQAKCGLVPNENIVSTTVYMYGVFNSHLTQGNTNFNRLLSVCSSQFDLEPHTGQRIFIELEGQVSRLTVPSAFEIGLNYCRWIYKYKNSIFQIRTWTSKTEHRVNMDFKILDGKPVNLITTAEFDIDNKWSISTRSSKRFTATPSPTSKMAEKFPDANFLIQWDSDGHQKLHNDSFIYTDGKSRSNNQFALRFESISACTINFIGNLGNTEQNAQPISLHETDCSYLHDIETNQKCWSTLSSGLLLQGDHPDWSAIQEILPWYGANAITHFLTPHGLEQFSGAAWGTRDAAQGPFELLLMAGHFDAAKTVLRIMFSHQNSDGGWPQWWMFDSYAEVRSPSSHADIYHWCLISLSHYLQATGDKDFLEEVLPYYEVNGSRLVEKTPLSEHIDRLITMITNSFFKGTHLVPFGGGDWNDAMQPADSQLAQRLVSTWTVALNYQAFKSYQEVCESFGDHQKSQSLQKLCEGIRQDFNQHLVKDGIVSGHGILEENGSFRLLLHPSDIQTNIQYRLLPMLRGIISGIFTPEQVDLHLTLIEKHLKGPDGARLMNRPPIYRGGAQRFFQRAESSPFFGREVGIMYTHAHLRYAEVQARTGNADAFLKALRQANPVAYRDIVPCGNLRQANCYYSSSDVSFQNRYEADRAYSDVISGKKTTKGGWRIYSSGPGIYIGLVIARLIGLRTAFGHTIIDPVIAKSLNGVSASINYMGKMITFVYHVNSHTHGPEELIINGIPVSFEREENLYRKGGAKLATDLFLSILNEQDNTIEVIL